MQHCSWLMHPIAVMSACQYYLTCWHDHLDQSHSCWDKQNVYGLLHQNEKAWKFLLHHPLVLAHACECSASALRRLFNCRTAKCFGLIHMKLTVNCKYPICKFVVVVMKFSLNGCGLNKKVWFGCGQYCNPPFEKSAYAPVFYCSTFQCQWTHQPQIHLKVSTFSILEDWYLTTWLT
jgi:hypothetical protein